MEGKLASFTRVRQDFERRRPLAQACLDSGREHIDPTRLNSLHQIGPADVLEPLEQVRTGIATVSGHRKPVDQDRSRFTPDRNSAQQMPIPWSARNRNGILISAVGARREVLDHWLKINPPAPGLLALHANATVMHD
jgi:hypothetical protein